MDESWFKDNQHKEVRVIRAGILDYWQMPIRKCREHLKRLVMNYGKLSSYPVPNGNWLESFRFAQEWNRYCFHDVDLAKLREMIKKEEVIVETGQFQINKETWSWLADLSFLDAKAKESPNHFFLKELFSLYLAKNFPEFCIEKESREQLFGKNVRLDIFAQQKQNKQMIVGEVGGVQLWKVMALTLNPLKPEVYVLPHWTTQKKNPFYRMTDTFDYVYFCQNGGGLK
ncbi:MAG TPA: hypothetical protein VJ824_01465 [Bacillota bacterium]|nr:hypothetical protein [Bacillota bacterium]